jgi:hypothetical protein
MIGNRHIQGYFKLRRSGTPVPFVNTPKAFANLSPGLGRSDNPGYASKEIFEP